MPKNLLQDMVKIKRTKRQVKAPTQDIRPLPPPPLREESLPVQDKNPDQNVVHSTSGAPRDKSRYTLWIVAIISIVFFLFSISYLFLEASVTVNPKIKNVVLNQNLSATKNANSGPLSFDLIVISGEENKTVPTTGEKDVLEKARGAVLIYNNFSSATQRLDIDTRLEGSNGKIYKTDKAVVVGGMKGSIPGSVEVGIYASVPGEEYNSGPLDFTIVGFKGTPKYSKFYARSKGEIFGGFKGKAPVISESEKADAINGMKMALQEKLFKKASDQIPAGLILFKDAAHLDVEESVDLAPSRADSQVSLKLKGTLYGFLFDEGKLANQIVADNLKEEESSSVYIPNIKDLIFSLTAPLVGDNISFADVNDISFNLKGSTKIVWKLDEKKLRADLVGKPKKDFTQILLQYPNIDSADLVISPFWKRSLPDKIKDIKVIVNYPK